MENAHGLMTALAFLIALLVMLRWIFGGTRRHNAPGRSRAAGATAAWNHAGVRRRDLVWTGSWQARMR